MKNRLIQADARDLRFLEPESVHLVFTSPPYHDFKDFSIEGQIGYGQSMPEFLVDMSIVFTEIFRLLAPGGKMVINSGIYTIPVGKSGFETRHEINLPGIFANLIERHTPMVRQEHYVWDKMSGLRLGGQPYPYKTYGYLEIEYLHVFHKPGHRKISPEIMEKSKFTWKEMRELQSRIWQIGRTNELQNGKNRIHPCAFPPALAERVIKLYSFVGDLVLDPFCGIGNTCIAAARNGRDFLGIDLKREYLMEAKQRLKEKAGFEPVDIDRQERKEATAEMV